MDESLDAPGIHEARAVFDAVRLAIDAACEEENYRTATAAAEKHGLIGKDTSAGFTLASEHERNWPDGAKVVLKFESYDTSKAFSIRPDVNKLRLVLSGPSVEAASHSRSYYD